MITIENIGTKNGLYVVRVEQIGVDFDALNGDYVMQRETEVKYILVNDYEAFKRWLDNKYAENDACRISYRKISEDVTILN